MHAHAAGSEAARSTLPKASARPAALVSTCTGIGKACERTTTSLVKFVSQSLAVIINARAH